jgi:hypothetical protein
MRTIHLEVPDYLARLVEKVAQRENVTIDQIVALALSAQVAAWNVRDDIETRALRGKAGSVKALLEKAASRPPLPGDELDDGLSSTLPGGD